MHHNLSAILHTYIQRFQVNEAYFPKEPDVDLSLSIVIPAFKEPDILSTLRSLAACSPPSGKVEVIITINAPENTEKEFLQLNQKTTEQIRHWKKKEQPDFIQTLVIREEALPQKHAGAGWARKIGMDEAAQRWAMVGKDGPILCLDADCTVSEDYLLTAQSSFADPAVKVGHFNFEHPYQQVIDPVLRTGIVQYELHLRCYIQGLKRAGYPLAVHTVGSCMAVRTSVYALGGGMNRRKAGEDFYFLHKLLPLGGWKEMTATVYPSCRVSDRVIFGTGKAQSEWQKNPDVFYTYHPEIYELIKPLFQCVPDWYFNEVNPESFSKPVGDFLTLNHFIPMIHKMKSQSNSYEVFLKKFWSWMDGFMVLKLTHHLRDQGLNNLPVLEVAQRLSPNPLPNPEQMLEQFRNLDRSY